MLSIKNKIHKEITKKIISGSLLSSLNASPKLTAPQKDTPESRAALLLNQAWSEMAEFRSRAAMLHPYLRTRKKYLLSYQII